MMCTKTMHNFSICVQSYIKYLINQTCLKFFVFLHIEMELKIE